MWFAYTQTVLSHTPLNSTFCCCLSLFVAKHTRNTSSPERIFSHFVILNIYFLQYTANFYFTNVSSSSSLLSSVSIFLFDPFCVDLFNQRANDERTNEKKKQPCYNNTNYIRVSFLSIHRRPRASSHGCRKCCSEELFFPLWCAIIDNTLKIIKKLSVMIMRLTVPLMFNSEHCLLSHWVMCVFFLVPPSKILVL